MTLEGLFSELASDHRLEPAWTAIHIATTNLVEALTRARKHNNLRSAVLLDALRDYKAAETNLRSHAVALGMDVPYFTPWDVFRFIAGVPV